ncbi:hypothetical protein D3C78_1779850 [compost metagenome]
MEGAVRVRRFEVQVRRNLPMLQRQGDLDQARDARGVFRVADIGLDRAQDSRPALRAVLAEHGA